MKKEKSCGIIVFDEDRVLLIKHNGGHISFPKGHVEKGETEEETAIRETLEETGIEARIIYEIPFINTYSPKKNHTKDVLFFVGVKTGGHLRPQLEEVSLCDFFTIEDAMETLTYDADREYLERAYKIYKDSK